MKGWEGSSSIYLLLLHFLCERIFGRGDWRHGPSRNFPIKSTYTFLLAVNLLSVTTTKIQSVIFCKIWRSFAPSKVTSSPNNYSWIGFLLVPISFAKESLLKWLMQLMFFVAKSRNRFSCFQLFLLLMVWYCSVTWVVLVMSIEL